MKKKSTLIFVLPFAGFLFFLLPFFISIGLAQVVVTSPAAPGPADLITITLDASLGNAGLKGITSSIYFHSGLITSSSTSLTDWKYTKGNWGLDDGLGKMTSTGVDKWTITIQMPGYYGSIPPNEIIQHIACVFRNADGTKTGKNTDGSNIIIDIATPVSNLPPGVKEGINYSDQNSLILCLYAPGKSKVNVKGDFNNWQVTDAGLMTRTSDGLYYWIKLTNLTPGKEYAYQYVVDGTLTIADPYCDKILDPWNDGGIPASVYPGLMPYPNGKTSGIVSIFQTAQVPYTWVNTNFTAPAVSDMLVYELLVRDFIKSHNYKALTDTLDYLKFLGINVLELMPVMEFEGNNSWGYDAIFMLAPDKYYGPKNDLKHLIDKAHEKGIAIVLDITLNHQFGQSPLVQLYWDAGANAPAANSPWFNKTAPHPYGVGYDMNHESQATKDFVDRVTKYWLEEYKVDGFRFDLSKGFTQKYCGSDEACWNAYDQSRVDLLKRIYDKIKLVKPAAYMILEHLSDNSEETVLAGYGMIPWGKTTVQFTQNSTGFAANADISWAYYKTRGWAAPNGMTYMESHDEERLMYSNYQLGNSNSTYNVKDFRTALSRMKAIGAFFLLVPGPKMMYQFGELGYDIGVNTIGGHTGNKPIRWDYYSDPDRFNLYQTWSQLINLKHSYPLFSKNIVDAPQYQFGGLVKRFKFIDPSMNVVVVGNFDITAQNIVPDFDFAGPWYDYLSGGTSINVNNIADAITLQPGEFHVWTSKRIPLPAVQKLGFVTGAAAPGINKSGNADLTCFPNPFSNTVALQYTGTDVEKIRVLVCDATGREIKILHDGMVPAGTSFFEWEGRSAAGQAATGIYILKVESEGRTLVKRVAMY